MDATDLRWLASAEACIDRLPEGAEFTIDDVTDEVGHALASPVNVLGALMSTAARRGLIKRVGYRPSRRAARRGAPVAIWRRCS